MRACRHHFAVFCADQTQVLAATDKFYRNLSPNYGGFYRVLWRILSREYGWITAGLSQEYRKEYGNFIAKAPPKYRDIMALEAINLSKYYRNPCHQPLVPSSSPVPACYKVISTLQ